MSSFRPESYMEAKERFKPLRRTQMKNSPSMSLKTSGGLRGASQARNSAVKPKAKRAKKLTDGQMKKKVWKEFSIFIRTCGADSQGMNRCVTCIVKKHWKELQAGHFIRGRLNANLFDERGVNPQCYICNVHFQGNVVVYYGWMLAKHGQAVIDELILQNNTTKKWLPGELAGLLEKYKALNDANPIIDRKQIRRGRTVKSTAVASTSAQ